LEVNLSSALRPVLEGGALFIFGAFAALIQVKTFRREFLSRSGEMATTFALKDKR
jgi:hypothetical protein